MITGTLPGSIRDQALEVISRRLGASPSLETQLAGLGGGVVADLLLDLEAAFHIGVDPDEVLPHGTLGMLVALVRMRAEGLIPARCRAAPVYDFAAARARRARGEADLRAPLIREQPLDIVAPGPLPAAAATAVPVTPDPIPMAVPSDAAWARALASQARERHARQIMLVLAVGAAAGTFGALVFWLAQLGVIR